MEKEASLKERPKAILLLAATATMWSLGGLLIKSIEAHALAIAGMRSVISAAIIVIATGKPKINWSAAQIGAAFAYAGMVILCCRDKEHNGGQCHTDSVYGPGVRDIPQRRAVERESGPF